MYPGCCHGNGVVVSKKKVQGKNGVQHEWRSLRWLAPVSITFTLTVQDNHSLSTDTKIMVSKAHLNIGERVMVIF